MRVLGCILAAAIAAGLAACSPRPDDRFVSLVASMKPSIVLLTMRVKSDDKHRRFDDAFATGFVVATGPWGSDVLTAAHAVDGAWNLHATIGNRRKVPARTIAMDKDLDVALVRIDTPALPVLRLGASGKLADQLGRDVGILGYPIPDEFQDEGLGTGTSLASGRLSSIRKDALEVTLPIVPGESGGPVFIVDTGDVIGIAESRFEDEPSIGFALPIDEAKDFLHQHDAEHGF
jgi:S1-C subfamily serine protease